MGGNLIHDKFFLFIIDGVVWNYVCQADFKIVGNICKIIGFSCKMHHILPAFEIIVDGLQGKINVVMIARRNFIVAFLKQLQDD